MQYLLFASLAAIVGYVILVVIVNRLSSGRSGPVAMDARPALDPAGSSISLAIWNVGYAALGANMDFVADGGTRYLPHSKADVQRNLCGIVETLSAIDADVFLLQEMAQASPMNCGIDVIEGVSARFHDFTSVFDPEVATKLIPPPWRIAHGSAIYSRLNIRAADKHLIASDGELLAGLLRRDYRLLIVRLPISGSSFEWVIVNVHLSAFDHEAEVRRRQLADVFSFAQQEFEKGNAVVIGGDWNLEFIKGRFPHTTMAMHRHWLHDFPLSDLPPGWAAAYDSKVPSVRTVHKAYVEGDNYVTVIDGYVLSPNVELLGVEGIDCKFLYSDHHPVLAKFCLRCNFHDPQND